MGQSPARGDREGSQGSEEQVVRHKKEAAGNDQDTDTDIVSGFVPPMLGISTRVWMRGWDSSTPMKVPWQ